MAKPGEDFAARMGRHLLTETDPATITDPAKPDEVASASTEASKDQAPSKEVTADPQGESSEEKVGHGMSMAELAAEAARKKEEAAKKPEEKPADKPAESKADTPATNDKATSDTATKDKKRVGLQKAPARATTAAPAAPAPAAPVEKKPEEKEKTLDELAGVKLTDDERDHLEVVRFAESKDERLKGALDREVKRIQAFTEFARKWKKDHPGEPIDTSDAEYKALLADHPPTLTKTDIKRFERQKWEDDVLSKAKAEVAKEKADLEKKLREVEVAPRVEQQLKEDEQSFGNYIEGEDMAGVLEKKGAEGKLARAARTEALAHVREFRRVASGLANYDPSNEVHENITKIMDAAGAYFMKEHKADLVQNGRSFLTRREYAKLIDKPDQLAKHWTFTDDQIAQIIMGNHAATLRNRITDLRKDLAEDGYTRPQAKPDGTAKPESAKPAEDVSKADIKSPRSTPSPSTGGGPGAKVEASKLSRFERMVVGDPTGS